MRITESILAVILVSSRYENQFLSLSYAVNVAVSVKFDSRTEMKVSPCISSVSRFLKKDRPTDPPNFHAKRANKPIIFKA